MTMMMTRTINDNEDEDLEGMVRFQTPCSKFQVRVVMFKVCVVDFQLPRGYRRVCRVLYIVDCRVIMSDCHDVNVKCRVKACMCCVGMFNIQALCDGFPKCCMLYFKCHPCVLDCKCCLFSARCISVAALSQGRIGHALVGSGE